MQANGVAESQKPGWRANAGWAILAFVIFLYALGSNLYEFIGANIFRFVPELLVTNPVDRFFDDVARLLMVMVGLIITLRARGRRSSFALGIGLAGLSAFPLGSMLSDTVWSDVFYVLFQLSTGGGSFLIAFFAIFLLRESGLRVSPVIIGIIWAGLGVSLVLPTARFLADWPTMLALVRFLAQGRATLLPHTLSMAMLLFGWWRSNGDARQRFFVLFLAVSVIISGNMLFSIFDGIGDSFPRSVTNSASALRITGSLLFAYAILRHRVIDIGFAVNRTLVYGAVAFTVLTLFGLIEYLAKITIPHAWPEAGAVFTAVIAVLLFLSFHHLHHWFEHHIERLFFHKWHVAEAELKRFVASAGHFVSEEALCTALADELKRYGEQAPVAIFMRRDSEQFRRVAGDLSGIQTSYLEEDRAFALMRTERTAIDLSRANSGFPGELVVPMLDQQDLIGFVIVGNRPDQQHFRPDEVENVQWAVHQVGLDLQALRARALEAEVGDLKRELGMVAQERDRLLARLSAAS